MATSIPFDKEIDEKLRQLAYDREHNPMSFDIDASIYMFYRDATEYDEKTRTLKPKDGTTKLLLRRDCLYLSPTGVRYYAWINLKTLSADGIPELPNNTWGFDEELWKKIQGL